MEFKKSFRFHFRGERRWCACTACNGGSFHLGGRGRFGKFDAKFFVKGEANGKRRKTLTFIGNRQIITQNILQIALHSYPKTELFFPKTKTSSTPLSHKNTFPFSISDFWFCLISRFRCGRRRDARWPASSSSVFFFFLCFSRF